MAPVHLQQPPPHHYDIPKKVASSSLLFSPPCLALLFFLLCQIAAANTAAKTDPFYGYEYIAQLSARFTTHLFACPPQSTHSQAKLYQAVTYAALILLQRSKARLPTACGSSGHCLFISAFMIASKVICDNTYSNKSWSIVTQGMFTLREINQSDGVRDVQLSRLGTHGRQPHFGKLRGYGSALLSAGFQGPLPDILPAHGIEVCRESRRIHLCYSHSRTQFHYKPHSRVWPAAPTNANEGVSCATA
ncbi:hypothetical protein B0H19DRAFT_1345393, partial [Mycena capillaripes]